MQLQVHSLAETEAWGHRLGEALFAGSVVALVGPLGAGKTHLVRAIAEGLGVRNSLAVNSPTFVLIQEYPARLPIFHFDAYRLQDATALIELGVQEYYEAGGVCLIEWADRIESALPTEYLRIEIAVVGERARELQVTAHGSAYEDLANLLLNPPPPQKPV